MESKLKSFFNMSKKELVILVLIITFINIILIILKNPPANPTNFDGTPDDPKEMKNTVIPTVLIGFPIIGIILGAILNSILKIFNCSKGILQTSLWTIFGIHVFCFVLLVIGLWRQFS
jgi:hypothetical protein